MLFVNCVIENPAFDSQTKDYMNTPISNFGSICQVSDQFIEKIASVWKSFGMTTEIMEASRHDRVLAMTSHIPQLIAYSVVGTATELETQMKDEVIKYLFSQKGIAKIINERKLRNNTK